jgi:uncharacterized phage protein gp47/JayE
MTTYGLTTEGLVIKTLDVVREDLNTALRAAFGSSINLGDKSIFGQIVGILSERLSLLWELTEVVNSSQDPDKATGSALEALCLLTGTFRPAATYSAVTLTLSGTSTTVVPTNSIVSTDSTEVQFTTTDSATITALTAWVALTPYTVGDRVTNSDMTWECITGGTSAASGGPDTEDDDDVTDGTVHWTFMGNGDGAADVLARATETGPVEAFARDITTIVNQISGWESVINLEDANTGRDIATDGELRLLREQELATGGSTPINALRAELLEVPDVEAVTIFVNNSDTTDDDGIPPHSIEALIRGPESPTAEFDQSIFDALLAGVAAGINTYADPGGSPVTGTATDDEGTDHTMNFSRPTEVPIYVIITLVVNPDEYPSDGDDQVKEAIVTWGDSQDTGKNAVSSRIAAAAFDVEGVLDVVTCYIDDAPAPASETTVQISLRELATYDTTQITVATSEDVP